MDAIRAELERVYQLVSQREEALNEREAALAAAMELAAVDPAVRAAFRDGIAKERYRWLALIDERQFLHESGFTDASGNWLPHYQPLEAEQ